MITKETIIDFFEDLKIKNDFNIKGKLLWGYFFLDSDLIKLKEFSKKIISEGYRFADIFEAEKEKEGDIQEYYLHVEKIEHHDVESLNIINEYFYKLAEENNINLYDGFDVGSPTD